MRLASVERNAAQTPLKPRAALLDGCNQTEGRPAWWLQKESLVLPKFRVRDRAACLYQVCW